MPALDVAGGLTAVGSLAIRAASGNALSVDGNLSGGGQEGLTIKAGALGEGVQLTSTGQIVIGGVRLPMNPAGGEMFVLQNASQVLTNKILASPTINGATMTNSSIVINGVAANAGTVNLFQVQQNSTQRFSILANGRVNIGTSTGANGFLYVGGSYLTVEDLAGTLIHVDTDASGGYVQSTGGANTLRLLASTTAVLSMTTTGITVADAVNFILNATTGTQIGTATTQKLAFYGSTPIVQPGATVSLETVLSNLGLRAVGTAAPLSCGAITGSGAITSSSATGGIGYAAGAGGAVTQATSKSTGVTLNNVAGAITMNGASLGATTSVGFTLTNSTIAATDTVIVNIKSGGTVDSYLVTVDTVAAGSCRISLRNYTAGALAEAVVLNFAVIKAVAA